jgi:hypothetical protein
MSAVSQEKPTLSNQELAKQLCLDQTKRALAIIIQSDNSLHKFFEEGKLKCASYLSSKDYFKILIKTYSKEILEIIVRFPSHRIFNRPIDGVSLENLPKTLEVEIPNAIYFGGIEVPKDYDGDIKSFYRKNKGMEELIDYIDDVQSFYCKNGDVEKGIEPFIYDLIAICDAIC